MKKGQNKIVGPWNSDTLLHTRAVDTYSFFADPAVFHFADATKIFRNQKLTYVEFAVIDTREYRYR